MRRLSVLVIVAACGGTPAGGGGGGDDAPTDARRDGTTGGGATTAFDPAITKVVIEIDYETNQAPYTGPILGFGDTFDLSSANFARLFAGTKPVELPRVLADMQDIGAVADEELTIQDILAIAAAHRDRHDSADTRTYYLVFVSGHYVQNGTVNPNILGVSIVGTGVIAMFKDVVRGTGGGLGVNTVRYVEQSTIVHEVAHALGMVGGDVPTTSNHEDAAHDGHCTNDKCVMYWLNEGASEATAFATKYVLTKDSVLFGPECLADADALTGGP